MNERVLVAMSGGVDSSVAAMLLSRQGYDVTGITMCFGIPVAEGSLSCCGAEAIEDARRVCDRLRIPHHIVDYSQEFQNCVIDKFKKEYLRGRTPNPCIDCNRFIKFGLLLDRALLLGFDYLATGHYAKLERLSSGILLRKAQDQGKDQTYFLYALARTALSRLLFPLGSYQKEEVRRLAFGEKLSPADKGESQDICFLPPKGMEELFRGAAGSLPGDIVDEKGNILGRHRGIVFYTVGQRTGLGLGGGPARYVLETDAQRNRLVVGSKTGLLSRELIAGDCNFLVDDWPPDVTAKIRYRKDAAPCEIRREGDKVRVIFRQPQDAITPGQAVVFYHDDLLLGGGVIEEVAVGH